MHNESSTRNSRLPVALCWWLHYLYLTDQVKNKTTAEAAALAEDLETIERRLGREAADRGDCVLLASEALLEAIRAYSDSARDHWDNKRSSSGKAVPEPTSAAKFCCTSKGCVRRSRPAETTRPDGDASWPRPYPFFSAPRPTLGDP